MSREYERGETIPLRSRVNLPIWFFFGKSTPIHFLGGWEPPTHSFYSCHIGCPQILTDCLIYNPILWLQRFLINIELVYFWQKIIFYVKWNFKCFSSTDLTAWTCRWLWSDWSSWLSLRSLWRSRCQSCSQLLIHQPFLYLPTSSFLSRDF